MMNEKLSLKILIRENLRESCFENMFSPVKMQHYQGFSDRVGRKYLFYSLLTALVVDLDATAKKPVTEAVFVFFCVLKSNENK